MPKRITEEDYIIAYSIQHKDFKQVDTENDILPSHQISAEQAIIKQQAFDKLSREAKDVIDVILNSPTEVVRLMATPKRHEITIRSVYRHLVKVFHSRFIARHVIREIQEWVNHL